MKIDEAKGQREIQEETKERQDTESLPSKAILTTVGTLCIAGNAATCCHSSSRTS